jgi:hypothetical protein
VTGRVVPDAGFAAAVAGILADPAKLAEMGIAARAYALTASWDAVFEGVYQAYEGILPAAQGEMATQSALASPGGAVAQAG